jgi:Domain of unknown function (DUF4253)
MSDPCICGIFGRNLMRRVLHQYSRDARIGLVPADVLARLGWQGAVNSRWTAEITAVQRSWEDRFGARLLVEEIAVPSWGTRSGTSGGTDDNGKRVISRPASRHKDGLGERDLRYAIRPGCAGVRRPCRFV